MEIQQERVSPWEWQKAARLSAAGRSRWLVGPDAEKTLFQRRIRMLELYELFASSAAWENP